MRGMSLVSKIGLLAAVVGAGSWLVVGVWHYNFAADIFGSGTTPSAGSWSTTRSSKSFRHCRSTPQMLPRPR